jgi:hypothetical protein
MKNLLFDFKAVLKNLLLDLKAVLTGSYKAEVLAGSGAGTF